MGFFYWLVGFGFCQYVSLALKHVETFSYPNPGKKGGFSLVCPRASNMVQLQIQLLIYLNDGVPYDIERGSATLA